LLTHTFYPFKALQSWGRECVTVIDDHVIVRVRV
jgi:hypothetical protein